MRRYLPLLLILFVIFPLSASRLRVGLYTDVPDFLSGYVDDVCALSFSRRVSSFLLDKVNYDRDKRAYENRIDRERHQAALNGREYKVNDNFTYTDWYRDEVEFVSLTHDERYDELVKKGNLSALEYLTIQNSLDLMIYFSVEGDNMILSKDMYIYIYGTCIEKPQELLLRRDPYSAIDDDIAFIIGNLFPDLGIVDLSKLPKPYIIEKAGESLFYLHDRLILPSGENDILIISHQKEEKSLCLNVLASKVVVIDEEFSDVKRSPLTITSVPYLADIEFLDQKGTSPLHLEKAPSPAIFTVSSPGFKKSVVQLDSESGLYTSHLRPEWSGNEGEVKKAKKKMYSSIRNTLLFFGLNSLVRASSAIWPDRKTELQPFYGITMGLSVMGVFSIIHNGYNYYSTAKDTYLQE